MSTDFGYYIHERVWHDGELSSRGGGTAYFTLTEREGIYYCYYTIAYCSAKDNFCRRIGRDVAKGRHDLGKFKSYACKTSNYVEAREIAKTYLYDKINDYLVRNVYKKLLGVIKL